MKSNFAQEEFHCCHHFCETPACLKMPFYLWQTNKCIFCERETTFLLCEIHISHFPFSIGRQPFAEVVGSCCVRCSTSMQLENGSAHGQKLRLPVFLPVCLSWQTSCQLEGRKEVDILSAQVAAWNISLRLRTYQHEGAHL